LGEHPVDLIAKKRDGIAARLSASLPAEYRPWTSLFHRANERQQTAARIDVLAAYLQSGRPTKREPNFNVGLYSTDG